MRAKPRPLITLSLLFSVVCYTPTVAVAQTTTDSGTDPWGAVKATPPGTELEVKLDSGKRLRGLLLDVSDTTLRLSRKDEITRLDRANVLKVYQLSPRSAEFKRLATSTGAALGGGVGVAVGLSSILRRPGFRGPSPRFVLLPIAGAAIGGVGGYVIASRMKSRMLIYDAGERQRVTASRPEPNKP